jgi:hypothetical protein
MGGGKGTEEPCVPPHTIRKIQAEGRICPRYVLLPENEVAAELAMIACKVGADHPLFETLFRLHTKGESKGDSLRLYYQIVAAISDDGISARIQSARERALRESRSSSDD